MLRYTIWLVIPLSLLAACSQTRRGSSNVEGMNPGECSDGADNDGDGDFDCRDSNCQFAPVCSDGAVPLDSSVRDSGGGVTDSSMPRDSATPRDATADTRTPDTSVPSMCVDASGIWESITECPLFPAMETITISRTDTCTFTFASAMGSGNGTVDEMNNVTINLTSPVPVTCVGEIEGDFIITDCLGCVVELRRL